MYIKRHMERLLEQISAQYPVLLVTGPRQVGKTTMLEHLAKRRTGAGRVALLQLSPLSYGEIIK